MGIVRLGPSVGGSRKEKMIGANDGVDSRKFSHSFSSPATLVFISLLCDRGKISPPPASWLLRRRSSCRTAPHTRPAEPASPVPRSSVRVCQRTQLVRPSPWHRGLPGVAGLMHASPGPFPSTQAPGGDDLADPLSLGSSDATTGRSSIFVGPALDEWRWTWLE